MSSPEAEYDAYHHPNNNNSYPLDPRTNENHLRHWKNSVWKLKRELLLNSDEFHKCYKLDKLLVQTSHKKIIYVKDIINNGISLLKIYETNGDLNRFHECCKTYLFGRETELIDYSQIYYNHQSHQVYIHQPLFTQSLSVQIHRDDEKAVKLIAADILDKIWIIHNCKYIHGDIKPDNIVKRAFRLRNYNKFISDGWKLINLDGIRRYKSKGGCIGCAGWTAPEMNWDSQKNKYLYSSDIWSFGLVILYALFGEQPLGITNEDRIKYGQKNIVFDENDTKAMEFKQNLKKKMYSDWYHNKLLKSEKMVKNHLVNLYNENKISLDLFELLFDGILIYEPEKRWNCNQIYNSKWFADIREIRQ